jgi:predicted RND superfamily exporter protein
VSSRRLRRVHPLSATLERASRISRRAAGFVLGLAVLVGVVAIVGVAQLRFSQDHLNWFPERDPIRRATDLVDSAFAGAMTAEVLVDGRREGGVYEPEFLERVSRAADHVETLRRGGIAVGKAISIVDIVEETHQALHDNNPGHRVIPRTRDAVAQELLLFESAGTEDILEFTDASYRQARISLRVTHADALAYGPFLERLESDLRSIFEGGVQIELTGLMTLLTEGLAAIVTSTVRSYAFALAAILPTMLILIGNRQRGLLSLIPNLLPVLLVLGVMGWTGIAIDASSLMVGGIILGLAVDDTIHFFHAYERAYRQSGDVRWAIERTLDTTGAAIVTTSLVLSAGFMSFGVAYMTNVWTLGFLLAFAAVAALLADLVLVPALLVLLAGDDLPRVAKADRVSRVRVIDWTKIPIAGSARSLETPRLHDSVEGAAGPASGEDDRSGLRPG